MTHTLGLILLAFLCFFLWLAWVAKLIKARSELYKLKFRVSKLKALEEHFQVAPYPNANSNVVCGIDCRKCKKTFSIDEGRYSETTVCPHCFHVVSVFQKPPPKIIAGDNGYRSFERRKGETF